MNTKQKITGNGGFTLIEIVLVMVFLGVALLSSMKMMSSSLTGSMNTEFITIATNLANEKMEQVFADKKSLGYSHIIQKNYPVEANPNEYAGFTRQVDIVSNANNKQVTITVSHHTISPCVLTAWMTNY